MPEMAEIVFVTGVLVIILCLAGLLKPNLIRRMVDFFFVGSRLYLAGVIRLTLGLMLLLLASRSSCWGYLVIIGIIAAASGLSIFFFALKRSKALLKRIKNKSDFVLRIYLIIGIAIWSGLLYSLLPLVLPFSPH